MSAQPDVVRSAESIDIPGPEPAFPRAGVPCRTNDWNPADFAQEQLRGLVRRVFFGDRTVSVKYVVFSAAEPGIDVADICDRVGRILALETQAQIAIVGRERRVAQMARPRPQYTGINPIKSGSAQIGINLWRVPDLAQRGTAEESGTGRYLLSGLAGLRNEFEYAVIQAPAAGISSEAALLGQLADGIILVVGANSTRKATARKIKEALEGSQSRILGKY